MLILCFSVTSFAANLGVMGQVYPIQEHDLLSWLMARLQRLQQQGQLTALEKQFQTQAINHVENPPPVPGLTLTVKPRTWTYDPSIVVDHDIVTPNGAVIARVGTRFNPLQWVSLKQTLIFIDGNNTTDLCWLKEEQKTASSNATIILVGGPIVHLMQVWHERLYFDQNGVLVKRFGIQHVPAIVHQTGFTLTMQEVVPRCAS